MRHPRPVAIRVERQEGEPREITVDPRVPWVQQAAYIAELQPTFVECLDAEGKVLRGQDFDELEFEPPNDSPASTPTAPKLALPDDPQSRQLVLFAQLIADAYRHTTDVAFDRMVDLFESINRRGETVERSLESAHKLLNRLTNEQIERAAAATGQDPDDLTIGDLVGAFMGGRNQAVPAPQPRPNGAHRTPPNGVHRPPPPNGKAQS
jgi:hypothetical protein